MIININNEFRIRNDERQWIIEKLDEKLYWYEIGYYTSLELAVKKLISLKAMEKNVYCSLNEYMEHTNMLINSLLTELKTSAEIETIDISNMIQQTLY